MLRNDRLQDFEESVVLGERVGCWGKLGGSAHGKLGFRRLVGQEREDVAVCGSLVWKDILMSLTVGDAASIARRTI